MNCVWKFCVIACCIGLLDAWILSDTKELFRLDIVHLNDFHARFEQTSVLYPVCSANDTSCLGGFARLYSAVQTLLSQKPDALLLNAGDNFQGTYWYTILKWPIVSEFMNLLPHDALTIGNHEFDDGVDGLAPFLASLKAPVVAANIDASNEPSLKDRYKPHIIVQRNGRKIGIIGITTTETRYSSSPGKVVFTDPMVAATKEAKLLTEKGVDIIILLSHCGLDVDKVIAENYGENIDVIVGGHSHSLLWNGTSPSGEAISGPYPVVVESKGKPGHRVVIVTASAFTKYIGNLTVWIDKDGEVDHYDGTPVFLNSSVPEDPHMKKLLQPTVDRLHEYMEAKVGDTVDPLLSESCGSKECAIGNIIADSFLEAGIKRHPTNWSQVSFVPRNTIRGSLPKGSITRGSLINIAPFTNNVISMTLKGKYLKEVFEHSLEKSWSEQPFNGPWMPQVAGLKLRFNTSEVMGERVQSILVKGEDGFEVLDLDRDYQVLTFSFIADGGNAFKMLKEHGRNSKVIGKDSEVLELYVKAHTPLHAILEDRITIMG